MKNIKSLKCIYLTASQSWAVELKVEDAPEAHRFVVPGPEHVETFLNAFDQSTESSFDPASGEIIFDFDYMELEEDDFDEDDEDEDEDDLEDHDEDGDDHPAPKKETHS